MIDSTGTETTVGPLLEADLAAAASVSLLQVVADPVRWSVLQQLVHGPACVCSLQEHLPIAANLLSYHLKVLRESGLVTTSRRGRWIDYALADDALARMRSSLPGLPGLPGLPAPGRVRP
ncbi:ArsR/SmtB family transcription factor [Streptomyces sp. NPDC050548]|uniref:ArsR/SmtB family transcription factor n=1 Tax=Streptomyces sp. NPDC050548 TaxID=3365629 RepID=UPI00378935AB